jgi:signal transduction histidine kinase
LGGIIDSLLVLAGVRRESVVSCRLDTAAIVAEATDRLGALLKEKDARIQLPGYWPVADGYAPWVAEVWVNYIGNAAKYGGPSPVIALGGEPRTDRGFTRFWVEDKGPGLAPAEQEKLFIPFTHISTARTGGHGLGLSIVRRIVEKLGGQVGVVSAPGAGARFWFELPSGAAPGRESPVPSP